MQIVGSFIRETHIERLSEIDRRGARRFDPDAQVDGGVADLSGGRNRAEPEQIILVIPFSVILNQQSEIAFDGDGSAVVAELERMNFAAENADVLELLRQHDFFAVDQDVRLTDRYGHDQRERRGFHRRRRLEAGGIGDSAVAGRSRRNRGMKALPVAGGLEPVGSDPRKSGVRLEIPLPEGGAAPVGRIPGPAQCEVPDGQVPERVDGGAGRQPAGSRSSNDRQHQHAGGQFLHHHHPNVPFVRSVHRVR